MKVKAVISFSGVDINMHEGQIKGVPEGALLDDLLDAGYVEPVEEKQAEEVKKAAEETKKAEEEKQAEDQKNKEVAPVQPDEKKSTKKTAEKAVKDSEDK